MRRGRLICFAGIDGSGKTTLARDLVRVLHLDGIEARYVYARYVPLLLRPLMVLGQRLFLRDVDPLVDYARYSHRKKKVAARRRSLAAAYQSVLMFDYFLQLLFKVQLPILAGRNLVCDRYVYDTVASDLAIDFGYSPETIRSVIRRWLRCVPTPDLLVFLDVPEDTACERKSDILDTDYVRERRPVYLHMAEEWGGLILDGTQDPDDLRATVRAAALRRLTGDGVPRRQWADGADPATGGAQRPEGQ